MSSRYEPDDMELSFSGGDSPLDPQAIDLLFADVMDEDVRPPPAVVLPMAAVVQRVVPPPLSLRQDVPHPPPRPREEAVGADRPANRRRRRERRPSGNRADRSSRRGVPARPPPAVRPASRPIPRRSNVRWCANQRRVGYVHHCTGHHPRPHNECITAFAWLPHVCQGHLPFGIPQAEDYLVETRRRILDLLDLGYSVLAAGSPRGIRALLRDRHFENDISDQDIAMRCLGIWLLAPGHEVNLNHRFR